MYGSSTPHQRTPQYNEAEALGILQHLDIQELQRLLDNETKLDDLVNDLQQVKNIEIEKQTLLASSKSVADYNLSQEPRLDQSKRQLAETYDRGITVQKVFEQNKQKFDYLSSQQSLDTTLALLQTEAAKSEEESEEVADSFLEGNMEMEDFVEKYIAQRITTHLRKVKADKMKELMRQREQQQHQQHSVPQGPPPHMTPPTAGYMPPSGVPMQNNWPGAAPYPAPGPAAAGSYPLPQNLGFYPR